MELIMRKRLKLNLAQLSRLRTAFHTSLLFSGAPNENVVQNHVNVAFLNVF